MADGHSGLSERIRLSSGALAVALAVLVLFGWASGNDVLTRIAPGLSAMNPMTAVSLLAGGLALWLGPRQRPWPTTLLAGLMVFVGAAKLAQLAIGAPSGVDQLLFADELGRFADVAPNRMAPNTAFALALTGVALIASGRTQRWLQLAGQALAGLTIAAALFAVLGYVLGLAALYHVRTFNAMALHAAMGLLALSVGILSVNPRVGLMRIIGDPGPAGALARMALPFALMVPVVVGLLRLSGERFGFYGTEDGVALQVFGNILATFVLMMSSIVVLYRSDLQRRRREIAVAASEERYRIAEGIGRVGHWRLELPNRRVDFSDELKAICGLPADADTTFETAFSLHHPGDAEEARALLQRALDTGEGWEGARRIIRPDGEMRHIKSHGVCERNDDGEVTAIFGVIVDVTELEVARRNAEAATAAKAAFLANMSHEIRTPMNGVLGFSELLLETDLNEEQRRHARLIHGSAEALLKLLNDILDV